MSATSEILAEQVRELERQINEQVATGQDCSDLRKKHSSLTEKLQAANNALNEGRQILKG